MRLAEPDIPSEGKAGKSQGVTIHRNVTEIGSTLKPTRSNNNVCRFGTAE